MNILGYLESCWNIVNTDEGTFVTFNCYSFCSHITHRLSHTLTKTFTIDKKLKQIILHVFVTVYEVSQ